MRMPDPKDLRLDLVVDVGGESFRGGYINTGVPHFIVPLTTIEDIDVNRVGRRLRQHRIFAPEGANVNFIRADGRRPNRLRVRTYERGVEAETLACGTGVTASAIIHALTGDLLVGRIGNRGGKEGRDCRIEVQTRSGESMYVSFTIVSEDHARDVRDVILEGAAWNIFEGTLSWPLRRA